MEQYHRAFLVTFLASVGLVLSMTASAKTCPTDLKKDHQGYWYSDSAPGWKSHKPTHGDVIIDPNNFGGAVYSPQRNRIACVYKASNGKWMALVSNIHNKITIDKQTADSSGSRAAWKYNPTHKDYACGLPSVKKLSKCRFDLGASPAE